VAVPQEASMDADVLALVEGLPRRFTAGRSEAVTLTVITAPAKATTAALRGEPRALTASRVVKSAGG
jgi:hypothetical protein